MIKYTLSNIRSMEDEEIILVRKDAIYREILYYEEYQPNNLDEIRYLTECIRKMIYSQHNQLRIEMKVKEIKSNFIDIDTLPYDAFVKYFY